MLKTKQTKLLKRLLASTSILAAAIGFITEAQATTKPIMPTMVGVNAWALYVPSGQPGSVAITHPLDWALINKPNRATFTAANNFWDRISAMKPGFNRIGGNEINMLRIDGVDGAIVEAIRSNNALGIETNLQVPSDFTAAQMDSLYTYLNVTKGLGVHIWSLTNEQRNNMNGAQYGWSGFGAWNLNTSATWQKRIATAIKVRDPNATTICSDAAWFDYAGELQPMITSGNAADVSGADGAGNFYCDVLSFHQYDPSSATTRTNMATLEAGIQASATAHGRPAAKKLRVAVHEWNTAYDTGNLAGVSDNMPWSHLTGQKYIDLADGAMEQNAYSMAYWSNFEGQGHIRDTVGGTDLSLFDNPDALGTDFKPRSNYWHQWLVSNNMRANWLSYTRTDNAVYVLAMGDTVEGNVVILANSNQSTAKTFSLSQSLTGATDAATAVIKVDGGLDKKTSGTLAAAETQALIFDKAGNLVKKYTYSKGANNTWPGTVTPPTLTTYTNATWPINVVIPATSFTAASDTSPTTNAGDRKCFRTENAAGVDMGVSTDGIAGDRCYVGWDGAGEYQEYTVTVPTATTYGFKARVASGTAGALFNISVDGVNVTDNMAVANSGWSVWQDVATTTSGVPTSVSLTAGTHTVRIYHYAAGFNLHYLVMTGTPAAGGGSPVQMMTNFDFATDITGWTTVGTNGVYGYSNLTDANAAVGILKADMTALLTNRYDARVYQDKNLTAGKTYKLSVSLRHVGTGSVSPDIVVEQNATPYAKLCDISMNNIGTDDIGLTSAANPAPITTTTWRTFTCQFVAPATYSARIEVMFGKVNQGVRIGTFSFTEE